ncbi:MAG: hypothetical protein JNL76_05195 [Alphaproteobacteria bacterium]|nr:hypothetical protein [Alphaproteobacteria bacterium]
MGGHFKYIGFLTFAVISYPFVGGNKLAAYAETTSTMTQVHWQHQLAPDTTMTTKDSTSQYDLLVQKNKAEYESLKAQVNNVPAMIAAKQCAPAGSIVAGPIPACPTSADLANLLNKNQAKEKALLAEAGGTTSVAASGSGNSASSNCAPAGSIVAGPVPACPTTSVQKGLSAAGSTGVSTAAATAPTVADYNAMVAKNNAEYESLKAQVNNVPAMIAAKQCAPAGSIVAGPIPACPTSADLANLLNKNQAKEKALLAQVGGTTAVAVSGSGNSGSSNCAPAGIVAGPLPPCPTTAATQASVSAGVSGAAAAPTVAEYQAVLAKNKAEYDALKAQIDNVPAMIAAGQCAPAGIVIGPTPLCPSSADLAKLAAKNSQQEQAMLAAMAGSSVAVADNAVKCAPAGSIVAGPIPACPTGTNTSGIQTTSPVVNINPEAMAAAKCATAGSIVAGPVPACPTVTALSSGATPLKGAALEASTGPVWATQ